MKKGLTKYLTFYNQKRFLTGSGRDNYLKLFVKKL